MFSIGEMVLIVVAGAWVFGPQDLPRIARMVGKLTGRATGVVYRARARLFQFAEESEITKLHQEMQATMYQLSAIRDELRGGINIINPGLLTQRVLQIKPLAGQSYVDPWQQQAQGQAWGPQQPWHGGPGQSAGLPAAQQHPQFPAAPDSALRWEQQQAQQHWAAPSAAPAPSFAAAPVVKARPQPAAGAAVQPTAAAEWGGSPTQQQQQQQAGAVARPGGTAAGEAEGTPHPQQLPVSALAAGLAPDRSKGMPSGAEIMLDALLEEMVAHQAQVFLQQQQAAQQQPQEERAPAQQQQQPPSDSKTRH